MEPKRIRGRKLVEPEHWWADREVLASVLARAIDQSDISDLDDARYFVEKPWKYDELHAAWLADPEYQS